MNFRSTIKKEIIISKSKNSSGNNSLNYLSGNKNELNQVFDSIEKINNLKLRTGVKYEVLICGPSESKKYFKNQILNMLTMKMIMKDF